MSIRKPAELIMISFANATFCYSKTS